MKNFDAPRVRGKTLAGVPHIPDVIDTPRLSEKTIELTFCAQIATTLPGRVVWFGLTQRQERRLGFDAAICLGGKAVLFQFKASNHVLAGGARRFRCSHGQMQVLVGHFRRYRRTVFYVFPNIGTVGELNKAKRDLPAVTWLLDVANLPESIPTPSTPAGNARISNNHYADLRPPVVRFHSVTFEGKVVEGSGFKTNILPHANDTSMVVSIFRRLEMVQFDDGFYNNMVMGVFH